MIVTVEGVSSKTFFEYAISEWEFEGTEEEFGKYDASNIVTKTDLSLENNLRDELVVKCGNKEFRFSPLWKLTIAFV